MGDHEDYPQEHDRLFQADHGYEGSRGKSRDDGPGRDFRERDRFDREPPREFERRREERDFYDRRDDARRRPRGSDRYDRGPSGPRDYVERRDVRSEPRDYGREPRDYGRERRRSRSRDRRRSRSRERFDGRDRRDERIRDGGGGGRRGRGGRGRKEDYSDEDDLYGGYKPRKRQGPPDPSKYDKPLPPGAGPAHIADPFYYLRQNIPTDPAEAQRLWLEQQLKSRQMVLQQQAASAAAASAKTQRELYIGNLVPGAVTDVALRQLFNTTLAAAFPVAGGADPVVNVNLHSDGRYAFVEFRTPEMATAALALNAQVHLLGQTISVGRPSGYVDPNKAAEAAQAASQALAAFQAGDMAGLAANATAAGMNLAQLGLANLVLPNAAGTTEDINGVGGTGAFREPTPPAGGLPFSFASTLGGFLPDPEKQQQQQLMMQLLQPDDKEPEGEEQLQQLQQQQQQQQRSAAVEGVEGVRESANGGGGDDEDTAVASTQFLCVLGMLSSDMLVDDEEYEAVIDDLKDECDRHAPGGVVAVKVPRPPEELRAATEDFMGIGNYGKALVSFKNTTSAQRARAAIHGRLFAGSTVHVTYITEEEFNAFQ